MLGAPGALIAVIGAIALSWVIDLGQHERVLGIVSSGLPVPKLPHVEWSWKLVPTVFVMIVVVLAPKYCDLARLCRALRRKFQRTH